MSFLAGFAVMAYAFARASDLQTWLSSACQAISDAFSRANRRIGAWGYRLLGGRHFRDRGPGVGRPGCRGPRQLHP